MNNIKKNSLLIIWILVPYVLFSQSHLDGFLDKSDSFFNNYIVNNSIDYNRLSKNSDDIHSIISYSSEIQVDKFNGLEYQSYWINLYNLLVIQQVINNYPIGSPMEVPGFFDKVKHKIGDGSYTLNQIENELLRGNFDEPRFHFVLVCGAKGCPPIVNFAYRPDLLDAQMEKQTRQALNNPDFIKVNSEEGKVQISEIFKWYPEDFKNHSGSFIKYINKYREDIIPEKYNLSFYTYNWQLNSFNGNTSGSAGDKTNELNVQTYTPSSLLKKGQFEVQLFNNLYTQTAFRDDKGEKIELSTRDNYFSGLFYVLLGTSKSGRVNFGFDVNFKSVRLDPDSESSPFKVLTFEDTPFTRTAISSVGPKIKFLPFKSVSNLSVQSSLWFTTVKDGESAPWFDHDATTWWTRVFYDRMMGTNFQLFAEADALVRFSNISSDRNFVEIPLSAFVSYFPTKKSTIYTMLQYTPNVTAENTMYMQTGLGGKYQILPNIGLEVSYTNFFYSKNNGAGSTINLGIRYVR